MAARDDDVTPTRQSLPAPAIEVGNGDGHGHDSRSDDDGSSSRKTPETRAERVERLAAETHEMVGHLARDVAFNRADTAAVRNEQHRLAREVSELTGRLGQLATDVRDVAKIVGVKSRTLSGALKLSIPPPAPPTEIKTRPTLTGEHEIIERSELDRIVEDMRNREAEERGAKEALASLQAEEHLRESRAKAKREHWTLVATLVGVGVAIASFVLGHWTH